MEYHEIGNREKKIVFPKNCIFLQGRILLRKFSKNIYIYFMINNERIENDIRISYEFNNYFVSLGSALASKVNVNSCNPLDYIQSNVQSMAIPNYYKNDVTLAINYLKNNSLGWDNIPTLIAKHVIHCYI